MDRSELFEQVAISVESWAEAACEAMTSSNAEPKWADAPELYAKISRAFAAAGLHPSLVQTVLSECFVGVAHSIMAVLDGATAGQTGRVFVVDEQGNELEGGLPLAFVEYLDNRAGQKRQ